MLLTLLLTACIVPSSSVPKAPLQEDPPEDTDLPAETEEPAESDEPEPIEESDPPPEETDLPDPVLGTDLCFPGANGDWDACVDVIPYDPAWGSDYDYPASSDARYASPVRFIDLDVWPATMPVAPNFILGELLQVSKGRYALLQPHFVDSLQTVRDLVGGPVSVNSGYRNPAYNRGVGGVAFSRHQWGDAADIDTSLLDISALGAVCDDAGAAYVGYYEAHVHCDWRDDPLEPALFDSTPGPAARLGLPPRAARLLPGPLWTAPADGWDEGEPLREWTALDASGHALLTLHARTFTPPPGAARVRVVVGREITLDAAIPR